MPQQISHPLTLIAQITKRLVRTAFRRNLLLVGALVLVGMTLLYFSRYAAAANTTWIGGGGNNNWDNAANWSGGIPFASDTAVFNASATTDTTINVPINVGRIQLDLGYTRKITQATGVAVVMGTYSQDAGEFAGGDSTIDINGNFALSGGVFTASSNTTSVGRFNTTGGSFLHNGGTVVFTGNSTDDFVNISPTLNNLIANKNNNQFFNLIGGVLTVTGTLTLSEGSFLGGTIQAQGAVSVGPNFDGGGGVLNITGATARTITFDAGAKLPNITLDASSVTINTTGTGTLNWRALTLQAGTINQGSNIVFDFSDPSGGNPYTQNGGTFNGGSGTITINGNFVQSGGAFNGSSGDLTISGAFNLSGGTFTASSGATSVGRFNTNGNSFLHNGGTVIFTGISTDDFVTNTPTLNNLIANKNAGQFFNLTGGLVVTGTLTLTEGSFLGGTIQAQGAVSVGPNFDGGGGQLSFTGAANQPFTNNGGANPTGTWTVNKPTGKVTVASNLVLGTSQTLAITSGTLDLGPSFNLVAGPITIGLAGTLRNFGTGNLTLGGDLINNGIININGGGTACGDPGADPLQIRSTVDTTVRTWSGNGTFSLVDVDVDSQAAGTPPGTITAFGSSVLGPNMGAGWTLNSGCPVEINSQPTNQTACVGGMASFSVGATGTGLSFQWRKGGTPLSNGGNISIVSGPNSSTLTINPVGAGDAASYDVVVTSSLGLTATSNPATLSLLSPPAITTNPGDTNVCEGVTASFTAAASGNPTPTVQWQESIDGGANFSDISGATSTTLSFTASASQNGNKYRAVFSNSCSSATTTAATLTVNPPDLAIDKSHTGDFTVGTNGTYTLTVTNAGACSTTGTITVGDTLPNGLSFISGIGTNWSCSANGQDVTCTNSGPLAGAAVSTITLTVGVAQAAVPGVTNTAVVSTPNDGNAANNSDSDPTTVNGSGQTVNPGDLIISEFRVRGPNGTRDEFVEIYNNTDADITVLAADGSSGFALVASDSVARFVIPNTTTIPARGHFLGVNSIEYSLDSYPGGNAPAGAGRDVHPRPRRAPRPSGEGLWDEDEETVTVDGPPQPLVPTATGDVTYTIEILDNAGIALFNTANPANFTLANRLDAVGSVSETNTLYKEGTSLPDLNPALLPQETEYSWVRRLPGGCTGTDPAGFNNNCTTQSSVQNTAPPSSGRSQDTDDNAADFLFVSTNGGTGAGLGLSQDLQRLGAPGPENLSAPIIRGNPKGSGTINPSLVDPAVASSSSPNRERVICPTPGTCGANQTFGTLDVRRRFTNNTGASLTRLRFRIMDISTFPNGPGIADIRALSSSDVMVTVTGGGMVMVRGTTLEEDTSAPNLGQPMGGGYNSSLSAGVITLATPLNPGASVKHAICLRSRGLRQVPRLRSRRSAALGGPKEPDDLK